MSRAKDARRPEPIERERERLVARCTAFDFAMLVANLTLGLLGGSLTIIADAIRGGLMLTVEAYALIVLHDLHRGRITDVEFGAGKLEVLCNVLIAVAKVVVALWIAEKAVAMILAGHSDAAPAAMALSACLGAVGLLGNLVAFEHVRDHTARGRSAIMNSQLIARRVKLRCAIAIAVALTVGATTGEPVIAAWADALGALTVSALLLVAAIRTIRVGLVDLLDRAVDPPTRGAIERALQRQRDAYAGLRRIRARRSGTVVFVEVALGFDAALPLAEVDRRIAAVRTAIAEEVAGADVSIVVGAHAEA